MQARLGMATRAERFRARQERKVSKTRRAKAPVRAKSTAEASGRERKPRTKTARKASYALETHVPGTRPTRKSTRKSANRSKPDSNLARRATRRSRSPDARHALAGA